MMILDVMIDYTYLHFHDTTSDSASMMSCGQEYFARVLLSSQRSCSPFVVPLRTGFTNNKENGTKA